MTIEIGWSALWVVPLFWVTMSFLVGAAGWRENVEAGIGPATLHLIGLVCTAAAVYAILQQL